VQWQRHCETQERRHYPLGHPVVVFSSFQNLDSSASKDGSPWGRRSGGTASQAILIQFVILLRCVACVFGALEVLRDSGRSKAGIARKGERDEKLASRAPTLARRKANGFRITLSTYFPAVVTFPRRDKPYHTVQQSSVFGFVQLF